jgi:hypothetical protein
MGGKWVELESEGESMLEEEMRKGGGEDIDMNGM